MGFFDFLPGMGTENGDDERADTVEGGGAEPANAPEGSPPTPLAESFADDEDRFDFSVDSIRSLDQLVDGLSPQQRQELAHPISAYLGEVFVRQYDGQWESFEDIGWVVSLSGSGDDDGILLLPKIMAGRLEGDVTFSRVHDDVVAENDIDGPQLAPDARAPGAEAPDDPLPQSAVEERAERAESLAGRHEEFDLDFTPASFPRLDALIAEYYDQSPEEQDRSELLEASQPGTVPQGASLRIGAGGAAADIAAYVGEVYRRSVDAEWHLGEQFPVIVIRGDDRTVELQPKMMTSGAFAGHVSFERTHEAVAEDLGLVA